jgi:hypothetical protein
VETETAFPTSTNVHGPKFQADRQVASRLFAVFTLVTRQAKRLTPPDNNSTMALGGVTFAVNLKPPPNSLSPVTPDHPGRVDRWLATSRPKTHERVSTAPWTRPAIAALLVGIQMLASTMTVCAQEERRSRVPVLGKIAGGSSHQAFSGKVQSVDLKRNLLRVDTVEGGATEFFPIKKNVPVSVPGGKRVKVEDLVPGTNILVYYDQKEDRRTVSQIVVLTASGEDEKRKRKEEEEKKPSPPSS